MRTAQHPKIQHYADGGLIAKIFGKAKTPPAEKAPASGPAPTAQQKPAAGGALNPANALKARESAAGLAKGGKVPGKSPSPTADNIPIMATAGEYMIKKKAVDKIGVKALDALNAIADKPGAKKKPAAKKAGPVRKMAEGGYIYNEYRAPMDEQRPRGTGTPEMKPVAKVAAQPGISLVTTGSPAMQVPRAGTAVATVPAPEPYKPNFTMGGQPPTPAGPPPQLGNSVPPQTAVMDPKRPNFTMGSGPQQPPPVSGAAQDIRAKYNPANGSPEAKAWQASRAAAPAPTPTTPATPKPGVVSRMAGAAGNAGRAVTNNPVVKSVARVAGPLAAAGMGASTIADVATTPTEQYEERFGMNPSTIESPGLRMIRDMGVRALGAASDMGNALTMGAAGNFYRDLQNPKLTPADAPATPAAPVAAAAVAPTPSAAAAPNTPFEPPAPVNNQVTRVGNSYSGAPGISGDITINGQIPRGGFVANAGDGPPSRLSMNPSLDMALSEARDRAMARGDFDAVRRSYGGDFGADKVDPIQALINNGKPMTARKAGAIAALQQAMTQAKREESNAAAGQKRAGAEVRGIELDNAGKQQLQALQNAVINAKTPAARAAAEESLRAFQGKYDKGDEYGFAPGGQVVDPATGATITQPGVIFNKRTGEVRQQASAPTTYVKDKVYQDSKGNKAKWDGTKFVPA